MKTIPIYVYPGEPREAEVLVRIRGTNSHSYTITHIPTGRAIAYPRTQEAGKRACRKADEVMPKKFDKIKFGEDVPLAMFDELRLAREKVVESAKGAER